jgi:hypothetical protein
MFGAAKNDMLFKKYQRKYKRVIGLIPGSAYFEEVIK